ncbi:DNA oxidative demethylase ALKBH2 isoform X2 [Tribolium castaneum]|uniref:DNA oxidative demethylase ALKBH2 n=2 Tax=Tribolium castaneum TaxID=7070 RepID=D6X1E3_TRICA|nr:PREDICTED: DNA oxidative demethylase ALKBH2 isoform X2 [Tribolium castaneum]XP_015839227.1 PREDICTED: DNA oxidative demethylase ALKBH2 isoform X2 [Tribolium castaneum]EFA10619.1 Alpha-ketoglutarate-dependent dioxygenase alkB homolog 2-like Protein [Tribolium castaneum]|eukprot:XP_008198529.1 PREDICTED: DNA oxidative demethylase ALKBH2 isoform X2 [Tribolium castaneum]
MMASKRRKIDETCQLEMKKITAENLSLDYFLLLSRNVASELMQQLEDSVEYLDGDLSKVRVFGKWHQIPRQQAAYGDQGTVYKFSGTSIPCKPWTETLIQVRNLIKRVTGFDYNFVLINRYRDGNDHIGEHKDNESELDKNTPIASLSLGQQRLFVFKHQDCRKKGGAKRSVPPVKIQLQHGSLLLMNPPTNNYWYHALPPAKRAPGARINLTFRKINCYNQ